MRSTALTALLLAACGLAFSEDASAPPRNIGVYFSFENPPSPQITSTMENEVASIMNPLGLTFVWRKLDSVSPSAFADLIVIRFKGSCEGLPTPYDELGPGEEDTTLAATQTSHGEVLHFTEVRCEAMRRYLASDVAALDETARDRAYGRALGRILAHEMYHVFGNTEKHGIDGIARASYSRRDLLQPTFGFEAKEAEALRLYAGRALRQTDPPLEH